MLSVSHERSDKADATLAPLGQDTSQEEYRKERRSRSLFSVLNDTTVFMKHAQDVVSDPKQNQSLQENNLRKDKRRDAKENLSLDENSGHAEKSGLHEYLNC